MDMTGEYRIPAPRQIVWEALNDPETLKASIVGCDELNRTGPNSFEAKVTAKVGPVKAKFGGKVQLEEGFMTDDALHNMDWLADGVIGRIR